MFNFRTSRALHRQYSAESMLPNLQPNLERSLRKDTYMHDLSTIASKNQRSRFTHFIKWCTR